MTISWLARGEALAGVSLLLGAMGTALNGQSRQPAEPKIVGFEVIAKQFAFAPARLEVTEGDRVRIFVRAADRAHGFSIRRFDVNKLVPRNDTGVTIEFIASEAGEFEILCSEDCGTGHEDMKGTLVVAAREKEQP